jgi:ADP-ribose pyrophosphatase YjhB (NUDIX family)
VPVPEFVVELRRHVGNAELWLIGVTAVVVRGREVLLVKGSDSGRWAPITGIVDPGEDPGVAARREAAEEACVQISVDRLAAVSVTGVVTHANGDRARYLDHAFACRWVSGEARVGDDESTAVRWWPLEDLPPMPREMVTRIEAATSGESAARFER